MKRGALLFVGLLLCIPLLGWATTRIVNDIIFDVKVEGRLKRAADANTVEIAKSELQAVLPYLEEKGYTKGSTRILYWEPKTDVGFWYENLTSSLAELEKVTSETSQLERTNLLMKLRETLLDQGQSVAVTLPPGISVFPHNVAYCIWVWLSGLVAVVGVLCGAGAFKD